MWWIIYISGFILTYLMCKWLRSKGNDNTWVDISATIFASIFSWGALIFISLAIGIIGLMENTKSKNYTKWL